WKLIEGPAAVMFGVFNSYEKQLWHDWIADTWRPTIRRVAPGSWGLPESPGESQGEMPSEAPAALIGQMAGNRHATPEGLAATRAYIRTTGLLQEEPR
ncbi:MAG: iron-containing redox enzyme family protein, partial [Pseudomonas putida]|nr:iron-containing redox enzyme family protein [Pseudomonas putida]